MVKKRVQKIYWDNTYLVTDFQTVKSYLADSVALCPSPVMNEKLLGVLRFFANLIIKEKQ